MSNKRKLLRLTEELYSQPHLISQNSFNAISKYLDRRNSTGLVTNIAADDGMDDMGEDDCCPEVECGIGVIDISGALTYKPVMGVCGEIGCSYTDILEQAEMMISNGCKTLILNCDSGGGEGYGAFETGNELRKMCDEAGVYSIAYNDGTMASACYALAVQCDEVVVNPASETGSIGVLIALMNNSKHLEQEGYTRSFISAGAQKIPFASDGSFKQEFLDDLQMKVDAMYEQFTSYVSEYTGLSVEAVKATDAKCFMAQDALALGLVNKIQTRAEFAAYIADNFALTKNGICDVGCD